MKYIYLILVSLASLSAWSTEPAATCTAEVDITEVIGPATVDVVKRTMKFAEREGCESILLLINTPGGSLESTRIVVEQILNSPRPFLCLVAPSGAHAGSAGAIIMQACHVNGALFGTNLGAATPISMGGEMPEDLRKKILNDTRSWLESLTRLRQRSEKFGQDIILEAKAVTAEEALRLKAIDYAGSNKTDFLKFSDGRTTKLSEDKEVKVRTNTAVIRRFEHDARHKLLSLLTDPSLAYLLLLGSLALIYFEITHPGTLIAGVVGGVGLIIALIALHKLDVEWGGLALIFLGIAMLIAEMFIPSFGALGIGGIVSFVIGSVFLFDPVKNFGFRLPLSLIMPVAIAFAALFIGVSIMLLRTRNVQKKGGYEDLMGVSAEVVRPGMIELRGELWAFEAPQEMPIGTKVVVKGHKGLILKVEKES